MFYKPIFIVGLPRSGTSMVAGIFNISGAWMGKTVPGGGVENPDGFFENIYLREVINKGILAAAGSDPLGVKSLPYFDELPQIPDLDEIIHDHLVAEGFDFIQPWAFKEPKLTLLWPCFAHAFPEAQWIIVRRPTEQIITSCLNTSFMKRQNQDPEFWQQWAEAYLQRLETLKLTVTNWQEIWSQEIINGDLNDLKSAITGCGLTWKEKAVRQFIKPQYWHY